LYRPTNALPPGAPVTPEQVAALNACINNLRQIDGAKQQWALENSKPANTLVSAVNITPYLPNNTMPICPAGGVYTINAIGTAPTCSMPGHQLPK
jgi:general secretion pathway protein G